MTLQIAMYNSHALYTCNTHTHRHKYILWNCGIIKEWVHTRRSRRFSDKHRHIHACRIYNHSISQVASLHLDHLSTITISFTCGGLAKVFYRGESRGKIPCQRPNPRAKTWHKIWMTGVNPNYDTIPIPSFQNSQNKCQKSSFTYDRRRHLILPLPPVHALPSFNARTCCEGAPIDDVTIYFFSIAQTIWIFSECQLSTDNYVNYQDFYYTYLLIS